MIDTIIHIIGQSKQSLFNVETDTYIDYDVENNCEDSKLKLVIMQKYQNIFSKGWYKSYIP